MSRFDFQSLGAAYTDAMAQLLAERKAEARQQMLDELARAADERAAKQSESTLRLQDQQINASKAAADREELKFYMEGLDPSIDPATQLPPEIVDRLVKTGRVVQDTNPQPSVQTSEAFAAPEGSDYTIDSPPAQSGPTSAFASTPATPPKTRYRFIGDKEYRTKQSHKQDVGRVIVSLLTSGDPKKVEAGQQLAIISSLRDGEITSEDINRNLPGNIPFYTVDPDTGIPISRGNVQSNAQISVLPRSGLDEFKKAGTTVDGRIIYSNGRGQERTGDLITRNDSESPVGIPQGRMDNLDDAKFALQRNTSDPEAINGYKLAAQDAVSAAKQGTQKAKSWANMFIDNPVAATQLLADNPNYLTKEEAQDANQILEAVGARVFVKVLAANTPKPEPSGSKSSFPFAKWAKEQLDDK